jgi:hypothetical protein
MLGLEFTAKLHGLACKAQGITMSLGMTASVAQYHSKPWVQPVMSKVGSKLGGGTASAT